MRKATGCWHAPVFCLMLAASAAIADAGPWSVPLGGARVEPLTIDAGLMAELPRQSIEAIDHGKPARFEGVWLRDVLLRAGAPLGKAMRGRDTALVVVITGRDGYATSYALVEFDPAFRDKPILLADRRNGEPLFEDTGPLQVIAADEQRAARWIRQVARIEIADPLAGKTPAAPVLKAE